MTLTCYTNNPIKRNMDLTAEIHKALQVNRPADRRHMRTMKYMNSHLLLLLEYICASAMKTNLRHTRITRSAVNSDIIIPNHQLEFKKKDINYRGPYYLNTVESDKLF